MSSYTYDSVRLTDAKLLLSFCFSAKGLKFFQELAAHLAPVSFCAFSRDGRCLATSSFDKTIIVWDPVSSEG